jgi:hypothetical protein
LFEPGRERNLYKRAESHSNSGQKCFHPWLAGRKGPKSCCYKFRWANPRPTGLRRLFLLNPTSSTPQCPTILGSRLALCRTNSKACQFKHSGGLEEAWLNHATTLSVSWRCCHAHVEGIGFLPAAVRYKRWSCFNIESVT